jgi:uncharacterized Zn finger protein
LKEFLKKAWGYLVAAVLLTIATVVWAAGRGQTNAQLISILEKQTRDAEKERDTKVKEAEGVTQEEIKAIEEEYDREVKQLNATKERIRNSTGPGALAEAWKNSMRRRGTLK